MAYQLHLSTRIRVLKTDNQRAWETVEEKRILQAHQTAIILCDVWDRHWCRGAEERLESLLPRMNETVRAARTLGVHIIHAPSDTMDFYSGNPARLRILEAPPAPPPTERSHDDPPLPLDASDGGCDTDDNPGAVKDHLQSRRSFTKQFRSLKGQPITMTTRKAGDFETAVNEHLWSRQHPDIVIDEQSDVISDNGREMYSYMKLHGIEHIVIMGVHTNMCILNRSFAIKQMVRWGVDVMLCRDLTDCMYNPAMTPYVSHDEGTALVISYIETFWCPTVTSEDLIRLHS
jgi:nicotinamidase-related amidase